MTSWKDNISFILIEPKEAGNIGASSRAVKNMGFRRLELVNPLNFPSKEAKIFAHGAGDVLDSAVIYKSLKDAVKDKSLIVGTTRRFGRKRGLALTLKLGIKRILRTAKNNKVAILFGRESKGLSNEETEECGFMMTIPTDSKAPSLNLAQAVLLVAYELCSSELNKKEAVPPPFTKKDEIDFLIDRIHKSLGGIGYRKDVLVKVMRSLRHLIGRAGLTDWELNMLHGMLSQSQMDKGSDKTK